MNSLPKLLENPKRVAKLVERERAARRPVLGWSGLAPRFDPQIAMFGDRVEVTVHPKSPAYRAGMRTGDVVIGGKIHVPGYGDVPLQNLDQLKLPAGTEINVRFCRPGATGALAKEATIAFKLARWLRMPEWEKRPQVACGKRVLQKERPQFLAKMVTYLRDNIPATSVAAQAYRYVAFLVTVRDNDKNKGIYTKHKTSAAALGVSRRTVLDLDLMLRWFGVVRLLEKPTEERNCNIIEITWPDPNKPIQPKPTAPAPPSTSAVAPTPSPAGSVRHLRFDSEDA
jgi:hypothetical protein